MNAGAVKHASRCRVCGFDAGLEFDHVPPKSAFDGNPAELFGLEDWLGRGRGDKRSAGPYTLCRECSDTASELYLPEFRRWCRLGAGLIERGAPDAVLNATARPTWTSAELYEVKPGRFVKQVMTMLLAIAPSDFLAGGHAELGEYAQEPRRRGLPAGYELYLALYRGPFTRFVGYSARMNVATGGTDELLELACPPFSCVLSLTGDAGIETTNITDFAELPLDEVCVVDLDLLNGFGHTPFPADFRTLAAVERDREADRRAA